MTPAAACIQAPADVIERSSTPARTGSIRACLFGAAPDTGNLGVSALCTSATLGLLERNPWADVTVFDHARGVRPWTPAWTSDDSTLRRCGAAHSKRLHRTETLWHMRAAGLMGLHNPGVDLIRAADAVLDVNGGDSFTDLYGAKRFCAMMLPMHIALDAGTPLVLLPQTYGPFASDRHRREAASIIRRAAAAWARDEHSFDAMRHLLGADFDAERHKCAPDMAFALPVNHPHSPLPDTIRQWLEWDAPEGTVGINVSGLIYNDPAAARERYALRADYARVIGRVVEWMLAETSHNVLLIPHVLAPSGHPESDRDACEAIVATIAPEHRSRIAILPKGLDECETKWAISKLEWVCATRMHACIAALSTGVPVGAVAYSDKARGVLESCGQGDALIDPRRLDTAATVSSIIDAYQARGTNAVALARALPAVRTMSEAFFDDLSAIVRTAARERRVGP